MNRVQASQFVPSMFIEHEPQMPSRQDRRKVSVGSISFLIVISASRTIGPQVSRSSSYVSIRGFCPESGSFSNFFTRVASVGACQVFPRSMRDSVDTLKFLGIGNRFSAVMLG